MVSARSLRRFREGDGEAVRALYDEYGRAVFAVAMRALGDRSLAEEATQLTFLRAWRAADQLDAERDPGPWIFTIVKRIAIDLYRRERRHVTSDGKDHDFVALPPSFEQTWEAWEVRRAIDELGYDEREIVRLTHFVGMSHAQVAEHLEIPIGTVKSRSHRAHARLAALLGHLGEASA